jgi:hypothetical protein
MLHNISSFIKPSSAENASDFCPSPPRYCVARCCLPGVIEIEQSPSPPKFTGITAGFLFAFGFATFVGSMRAILSDKFVITAQIALDLTLVTLFILFCVIISILLFN